MSALARVVVMMGLHLSVGEADQALTSTVRVRATWYLLAGVFVCPGFGEMRRWDARRPLNALLQRYTLLAPVHPNLAAVGAIPVQKNGCSVGSNLVQHAL